MQVLYLLASRYAENWHERVAARKGLVGLHLCKRGSRLRRSKDCAYPETSTIARWLSVLHHTYEKHQLEKQCDQIGMDGTHGGVLMSDSPWIVST